MPIDQWGARIKILHGMYVFYKPDMSEPIEKVLDFMYTEEGARNIDKDMAQQGYAVDTVFDYLIHRETRAFDNGHDDGWNAAREQLGV